MKKTKVEAAGDHYRTCTHLLPEAGKQPATALLRLISRTPGTPSM